MSIHEQKDDIVALCNKCKARFNVGNTFICPCCGSTDSTIVYKNGSCYR